MAEEAVEEIAEEEASTLLTEADENTEPKEASSADSDQSTDSPADDKADDKADQKKEVPEQYKFEFKEGTEIDQAKLDEFIPMAKELNLSQAEAQKLVDIYAKTVVDVHAKQQQTWADTLSDWRETATKDPEYGGKDFQQNVGMAKKALDTFGNEKVKEALNTSGMGNHPEIIRLLVNVGKAVSDDSFVFGKSGQQGPVDPAKVLFPDLK